MNCSKSTRKNAIPGIWRELHFDEGYTLEIAFLQSFCIMEVCGGSACLWLYLEHRAESKQDLQLLNARKMGEHGAEIEKINLSRWTGKATDLFQQLAKKLIEQAGK